jgi:hypothetical protein
MIILIFHKKLSSYSHKKITGEGLSSGMSSKLPEHAVKCQELFINCSHFLELWDLSEI